MHMFILYILYIYIYLYLFIFEWKVNTWVRFAKVFLSSDRVRACVEIRTASSVSTKNHSIYFGVYIYI